MDLTLSITSPLPLEPLVVRVEMEDGGAAFLLVEDGWFHGSLRGQPVRVVGLAGLSEGDHPPIRSVIARPSSEPTDLSETGRLVKSVDIHELFERGVAVPADGVLRFHLLWLAPCDGAHGDAPEGTRFGSAEHTMCAALIGQDAKGKRLEFGGIRAHFNGQTVFDVGGKKLDFGMIIALAGDFYAHLDDRAVKELEWAWPPLGSLVGWLAGDYRATTLVGDTVEHVTALDEHIHKEAAGIQFGGVVTAIESAKLRFPMRRYLALASQNHCHFACQNWSYSENDNPALALYEAYHARAKEQARAAGAQDDRAGLDEALVVDAFGCHFLTDLFASGHIRTPRAILGQRFGIAVGALVMSKRMHDQDNQLGLWVTPLRRTPGHKRVVWRAYGDDSLFSDQAKPHFAQTQEAVRRSVAEVFAAYCEGKTKRKVPVGELALDLVPVPLLPEEGPDPELDTSPDGTPFAALPPNHLPLYKILEDGRVAELVLGGYLPLEWPSSAPVAAPVTG